MGSSVTSGASMIPDPYLDHWIFGFLTENVGAQFSADVSASAMYS